MHLRISKPVSPDENNSKEEKVHFTDCVESGRFSSGTGAAVITHNKVVAVYIACIIHVSLMCHHLICKIISPAAASGKLCTLDHVSFQNLLL